MRLDQNILEKTSKGLNRLQMTTKVSTVQDLVTFSPYNNQLVQPLPQEYPNYSNHTRQVKTLDRRLRPSISENRQLYAALKVECSELKNRKDTSRNPALDYPTHRTREIHLRNEELNLELKRCNLCRIVSQQKNVIQKTTIKKLNSQIGDLNNANSELTETVESLYHLLADINLAISEARRVNEDERIALCEEIKGFKVENKRLEEHCASAIITKENACKLCDKRYVAYRRANVYFRRRYKISQRRAWSINKKLRQTVVHLKQRHKVFASKVKLQMRKSEKKIAQLESEQTALVIEITAISNNETEALKVLENTKAAHQYQICDLECEIKELNSQIDVSKKNYNEVFQIKEQANSSLNQEIESLILAQESFQIQSGKIVQQLEKQVTQLASEKAVLESEVTILNKTFHLELDNLKTQYVVDKRKQNELSQTKDLVISGLNEKVGLLTAMDETTQKQSEEIIEKLEDKVAQLSTDKAALEFKVNSIDESCNEIRRVAEEEKSVQTEDNDKLRIKIQKLELLLLDKTVTANTCGGVSEDDKQKRLSHLTECIEPADIYESLSRLKSVDLSREDTTINRDKFIDSKCTQSSIPPKSPMKDSGRDSERIAANDDVTTSEYYLTRSFHDNCEVQTLPIDFEEGFQQLWMAAKTSNPAENVAIHKCVQKRHAMLFENVNVEQSMNSSFFDTRQGKYKNGLSSVESERGLDTSVYGIKSESSEIDCDDEELRKKSKFSSNERMLSNQLLFDAISNDTGIGLVSAPALTTLIHETGETRLVSQEISRVNLDSSDVPCSSGYSESISELEQSCLLHVSEPHRDSFHEGIGDCLGSMLAASLTENDMNGRTNLANFKMNRLEIEWRTCNSWPPNKTLYTYSPRVFKELRGMFKIDENSLLGALSGAFRRCQDLGTTNDGYYSSDYLYIIQPITRDELWRLQKMLWRYHDHMRDNKDSLIPRYYGMYWAHIGGQDGDQKLYFVLMDNVAKTNERIDRLGYFCGSAAQDLANIRAQGELLGSEWLEIEIKSDIALCQRRDLLKQFIADVKFLVKVNARQFKLKIAVRYPKGYHQAKLAQRRGEDQHGDMESLVFAQNLFQYHDGGFRGHTGEAAPVYYVGIVDCLEVSPVKLSTWGIRTLSSRIYGDRIVEFFTSMLDVAPG